MVLHKDCFAYRGLNVCVALKEQDCYQCPFYKTNMQLADQLARLEKMCRKEEAQHD